jgi:FkbM family methyltransferase
LKRWFDWGADRFRERDGRIRKGVGRGLGFNAGRSNAGFLLGTSEPGVQAALAMFVRPGQTFYDVGANVGFHTVIAARLVGPAGRVVAFEPLPTNAQQIEHNVRLNGFGHVAVRAEALGRSDGEEIFLVSSEATWGKLASTGRDVAKKVGEVRVSVRCLDSLAAQEGLPPPAVMKIDVEGAEVEVLIGATAVLRRNRPVLMIELHGTNAAVAGVLKDLDYASYVLGSPAVVAESPWDAYVVAVPTESEELMRLARDICAARKARR